MLPIYYINLASRPDRQRFIEEQLGRLGLKGQRIEAVTPANISPADAARYCDPHKPVYLRPNELACSLSHERVWRTMLDAGESRALVLEDDAELSQGLPAFLAELEGIDADLIRLESAGRPLRLFPTVARTAGGVELRPFRSTALGTAAYIITARAARYLQGHPAFRTGQTDLVLYNPFDEPGAALSRLQTVPALARQLADGGKQQDGVGRSDIDRPVDAHRYPMEQPLQYRLMRIGKGMRKGWRNATDHFANLRKGLVRMHVPFADEM